MRWMFSWHDGQFSQILNHNQGDAMADGTELHEGFAAAQVLADRLYNMQRDQISEILVGIKELKSTQATMHQDITAVKIATECIPDLSTRIDKLEANKDRQNGAIAIFVFLFGIFETVYHLVFHKG